MVGLLLGTTINYTEELATKNTKITKVGTCGLVLRVSGGDQVNGRANVSTPTPPIIDDVDDPTSTQGEPKGQPPLIFVLSVIFVATLRTRTRTASNISAAVLDQTDRR